MRDILKGIRNNNFKDHELDIDNKEKSYMYKYLNRLSLEQLKIAKAYIFTGRELSTFYGATSKLRASDYIYYFLENDMKLNKYEYVNYFYDNKDRLNNYIDTVLKYTR